MTYAGIEYAIRAGVGRNEWVLLISFPDNAGGGPTALHYSGSRNDALAEGKKRINSWLRRQKKRAASSPVSPVHPAFSLIERTCRSVSASKSDDG